MGYVKQEHKLATLCFEYSSKDNCSDEEGLSGYFEAYEFYVA